MKNTKSTSKLIKWTNSKGEKVVAKIEIVTSKVAGADGDSLTVDCCEWIESVELDGEFVGDDIREISPVSVNGIKLTGKCESVGIPSVKMDAINKARTELRASPEWVAHQTEIDKNTAEVAEYERHASNVEHMMTLGGKTY